MVDDHGLWRRSHPSFFVLDQTVKFPKFGANVKALSKCALVLARTSCWRLTRFLYHLKNGYLADGLIIKHLSIQSLSAYIFSNTG